MIAVLISFEAIEIAYSDIVDNTQHVMLSQASENTYSVVKEGVKIKKFFEHIVAISQSVMEEEQSNGVSFKPLFVCFSPKNKKATKEVFQCLSQKIQNRLVYFNINKGKFEEYSFNRPIFINNQICFGQGFSQLRAKEQLRIALVSHLKCSNIEYIFLQKNANEIKELKKQGYTNILDQFDTAKFDDLYQRAKTNLIKSTKAMDQAQPIMELVQKYPFAKKYFQRLYTIHKEVSVKTVNPFQPSNLTMQGMVNQLFVPSTYYNISPKSWINNQRSQEIVSYVFHNLSDQQLYLAKTSRPKDLSNQQDFQIKILTYYLTYFIDREAFCVPHDKHSTLIKFSKIKAYQNKKAYLNVRPYIEGIQTLSELKLKSKQYLELFTKSTLFGRKVKGVGGVLLFSWIINQNFHNKILSQQTTLLSRSSTGNLTFVNQSSLYESDSLVLCRTDYFSPFKASNFKVFNEFTFVLHRDPQQQKEIFIGLGSISQEILQQMCDLLFNIGQQTLFMIKNLFVYYRWNTKMIYYYDMFKYRFNAICEMLRHYKQNISVKPSLLLSYPRLACLLIPQNYDYFLLSPNNRGYFPYESNFEQQQKDIVNPYLGYMNKGCSFAIYKIDFPNLSFLQWIKSTSKFQIIEYMSMINKSLEEYIIMDKRLKLSSVNDKKNVVLIIDHAQLIPEIISKPKGIKTVLIYRLKKPEENQDVAIVGSEVQRKDFFDQSEDELIKVLFQWGSRALKNVAKLQLFDWVLQSYIHIKCGLFNLSSAFGRQFLITLHKATSTNRHRLKQLSQNHKQNCNYLYTYPIYKHNQKINLNYRLFQFLHVKTLFNEIIENRWNCKLQTYQNASVNLLRPIMDLQTIEKIIRQIIVFLRKLSDKKLETFQYSSLTGDCLQLARSLTQPNKTQQFTQQIKMLHYEIFVEIVKIKNYNSIENCIANEAYVCLNTEQSLEILSQSNSKTIPSLNCQVLALISRQNKIFVLNFNKNSQKFMIEEFTVKQGVQIQPSFMVSYTLENLQIVNLLQQKRYKKLHFHRYLEEFILSFVFESSILVISMNPLYKQALKIHNYSFSHNIVDTYYIEGSKHPSLVCATIQEVSIINIETTNLAETATNLFSVNFGITNIFAKQTQGILHIFLYKLHVFQYYIIKSDQVVLKTRVQLNKNIKILTFHENYLFVFYENLDIMDVFKVKEAVIDKIWTYYWVQPNVRGIYPMGDSIFLKSFNYIKQIRLRNGMIKEEMSDK